jgi:membrane-associated protease RseP (regulator of RpoE activity)
MTVLLAGVTFNFLLAFFLFVALFYNGVAPLAINTKFETATETRLVPSFERSIEIGMVKGLGN